MIIWHHHELIEPPSPWKQRTSAAPFSLLPSTSRKPPSSCRDHDAAQAVSNGLCDAKAANTRRVYQTSWHLFRVDSGRGRIVR